MTVFQTGLWWIPECYINICITNKGVKTLGRGAKINEWAFWNISIHDISDLISSRSKGPSFLSDSSLSLYIPRNKGKYFDLSDINQSLLDSLGCDLWSNYWKKKKVKASFYSQQGNFFLSLSFSGCEIFNENAGSGGKLSRKACWSLNLIFSPKYQMEPYWQWAEDLLSL